MEIANLVWIVLELIFGLGVMVLGARILIEAAKWLVKVSGVSNLFVGATLLSLVTIVLELFVGVAALNNGLGSLVVTVVLGVVMVSLGVVMALNLIITPREISRKKFLMQMMSLVGCLIILGIVSQDGIIKQGESLVLIGTALVLGIGNWVTVATGFWQHEKSDDDKKREEKMWSMKLINWQLNKFKEKGRASIALNVGRIVIGGILLLVAAGYLLRNSSLLAINIGWSTEVLALTLMAWAVALPTVMTALMAGIGQWRKESERERKEQMNLSVGNIMGINLMGMTLIVGGVAFLQNVGWLGNLQKQMVKIGDGTMIWNKWKIFGEIEMVAKPLRVENSVIGMVLPLALIMCLVLLVPAGIKGKLYRWQGMVLLIVYCFYLVLVFT